MANVPNDMFKPELQNANAGTSVLMITGDKVEDLEFFYPYYRFLEAGFRVDVATPNGGSFEGKNGTGLKETRKVGDVSESDYNMLYLPGGKAPAELRKDKALLDLTRQFVKSGKVVAAICHGPQILAAADVIKGKKIAAFPEVEPEITSAGATFVNQACLKDGQFITARWPADLPAHMKEVLLQFARTEDVDRRQAA